MLLLLLTVPWSQIDDLSTQATSDRTTVDWVNAVASAREGSHVESVRCQTAHNSGVPYVFLRLALRQPEAPAEGALHETGRCGCGGPVSRTSIHARSSRERHVAPVTHVLTPDSGAPVRSGRTVWLLRRTPVGRFTRGGGQRRRACGFRPLRLPIAAGARSPRRGLATLLAAALVSLGPSLLAQTIAPANPPTLDDGRPVPMAPAVIDRNERGVTVRATRITTPMVIDGRLDEPVYDQIRAITEFEQQAPKEGAPVSERTEAWIFYDDTNLYVACRCLDADPSRIVANDMRRDSVNLRQNDNFGVLLDTFHDRRNGYLFYVSPVGGMFDAATSDERVNNADWNTVWLAKATRSDQGWFAEIAIPFKSLRYRAGREQTWGIILRRTIRGKNEYAYITPIKPQWGVGAFFRSSAAATLIGLEAPPAAKNLEIKPYAISRLTTDMLARPVVRTTRSLHTKQGDDLVNAAALDMSFVMLPLDDSQGETLNQRWRLDRSFATRSRRPTRGTRRSRFGRTPTASRSIARSRKSCTSKGSPSPAARCP